MTTQLRALAALALLSGCASGAEDADRGTQRASATSAGAEVTASERAKREAARRHPIAQPEPRPRLPEKAPPPRPARGLPEQTPPPRQERGLPEQAPQPRPDDAAGTSSTPGTAAEDPAADYEVVTTTEPPPLPRSATRPPRPAPEYVWAPGYWYWYSDRYVWIDGGWLPPRYGYTYVGARWVWSGHAWAFVPGGWAIGIGGTVVYPVYRHRYLYGVGHHHDHHRRDGWYGHSRSHRPHYRDAPSRGSYRDYRGNRTTSRPRSPARPSRSAPPRPRVRGGRTTARPL